MPVDPRVVSVSALFPVRRLFLALRPGFEPPCVGHGDLFYVRDDGATTRSGREPAAVKTLRQAQARALCARCSASSECLDEALTRCEQSGIWGGLSAEERTALALSGEWPPALVPPPPGGPGPDDDYPGAA